MARVSTGVVKQVEGKGFEKVGDNYEGRFLSVKTIAVEEKDGTRDAKLYKLQPDDGEAFGVWGSPQLDDLMNEISTGTYVKITFKSEKPAKKKGWSPMKVYEVETFSD